MPVFGRGAVRRLRLELGRTRMMRSERFGKLAALALSLPTLAFSGDDVNAPIDRGGAPFTLLKLVAGGEVGRTRPLVDYCEAAHADNVAELKAASDQFIATLKVVLREYFSRSDSDADLVLPGTAQEYVESTARRCLAAASKYRPQEYCRALLDSYRHANRAQLAQRVEWMASLMSAFAKSDRYHIVDGPGTSTESRDCGPSRIATEKLPLR
jgi:hypothetical protein